MTHNDITGDRIETSQCADCLGTLKKNGGPCPVCCPTDDGPDDERNG